MADAVIGALRVVLGADTAAFETGLKAAQKRLGGFELTMGKVGVAIGAAITGAATMVGIAVSNTLEGMGDLADASQKIGVPVEELTALKHAAELAGVPFETLEKSLGKLSRTMLEVAQGAKGPAKQAFDALGISVKNADGSMKSSSEMMSEVADRFARMEDGSTKTALAMNIFGRAGAELIPLLNEGKAGIQAMKDEAVELGLVFSTEAARDAEAFGDNLDRLGKVWDGIIIQISAALAGPLKELTDKLVELAKDQKTVEAVSETLISVMSGLGDVLVSTAGAIKTIREEWTAWQDANPAEWARQAGESIRVSFLPAAHAAETLADGVDRVGINGETLAESAESLKNPLVQVTEGFTGMAEAIEPVIVNQQAAAAAQKEVNAQVAEGARVFEATRTPAENLSAEMAKLNVLLRVGAIDFDTYQRAVEKAKLEFPSLTNNMATFFQDMGDNTKQATSLLQGTFGTLQDSLSEFFQTTKFDFDKLLDGMKKGLADFLASKVVSAFGELLLNLVTGGTSGLLSGGGGLLGGLLGGIGDIFGFAEGGSFTVGGPPGVDRPHLIGLAGGEQVDITPAGEQFRRGRDDGSSRPVNLTIVGETFGYKQVQRLARELMDLQRGGGKIVLRSR